MGIFDKIKDAAQGRDAEIDGAIDKAGDFIDEKTGGKYADQVDQVQELAKEHDDKITGGPDQNAN